jgi:hypothetical protein
VQQPHPPVQIPVTGSKESIEFAGKHDLPSGHHHFVKLDGLTTGPSRKHSVLETEQSGTNTRRQVWNAEQSAGSMERRVPGTEGSARRIQGTVRALSVERGDV